MKQVLFYSLKVWLTGFLLPFSGICIYILIRRADFVMPLNDFIVFSLGMMLLSLAFGVPFCAFVLFVRKLTWHYSLKKLLLSFISFPLSWLPMMIFVIGADELNRLSYDKLRDVMAYLTCNLIAIWIYKLDAAPLPSSGHHLKQI